MFDLVQKEKEILAFWERKKVLEKILKLKRKKIFVFFEGPPTLNAEPGIHHALSRSFKDLILRYKTMNGFFVTRKAGWDTHGLPVELEIEKKLGFKFKRDIEKFGIDKFNNFCRDLILNYKGSWEKMSQRLGFWLDFKNAYLTCSPEYIESLWFILKVIWQKGLLYQDLKVSPYCPRCQTVLSSHEVAQEYKKIIEKAIFVKFKLKDFKMKNCSFLVWTTTPWTLPANVALAVNPRFSYLCIKIKNENFILAEKRFKDLGIKGEIVERISGKKLIGLKYYPLFDFYKPSLQKERIWEVLAGDFVNLEEGTGIVHIAPAFGEEDMELIKSQNSKIKNRKFPIILNVNEEGKFKEEVKKFAGIFVKDAESKIIQDLKERDLLFKEELHEHDYPFCWRCKAPLLYFAKKSWFIKMSALKKELIKCNKKINWIPSHLKEGRFGEWLKEVKDWALSRERFWGTPLPIWKCSNCSHLEVIGSLEEIAQKKFSTNQYFILRHGQTIYQTKKKNKTYPYPESSPIGLTKRGVQQIKKLAKRLKNKKIDLIYSSDLFRAKQTAKIIAKELNLKVIFAPELRDLNLGIYHGKSKAKYYKEMPVSKDSFEKKPKGGESWLDCQKRMINFLFKIDKENQNKKILIVSHGDPLWLLEGALRGKTKEELIEEKKKGKTLKVGELRKLEFKILPLNEKGEIDLHRPFVDKVEFLCPKCNGKMRREKEVIDCWFDSGAMPFAQGHWPFAQSQISNFKIQNYKKLIKKISFPADYICEGVDQTRGWFYTLLAISVLLGFERPYKNVLSLGHVLDKKGEKMSKSKGNVVDPFFILEKYGADALRWYFFTVNQPWESKRFNEDDILNSINNFLRPLLNVFRFFEIYSPGKVKKFKRSLLSHILDRWILSRLQNLVKKTRAFLEKYLIFEAAREIEKFVLEDFSNWYLRLSRERLQENKEGFVILKEILLEFSKLIAPFAPFVSERIYQKIGPKISVHFEEYPVPKKDFIFPKIEKEMEEIRKITSLILSERKKLGIKLRQPLLSARIENFSGYISDEGKQILLEATNLKKIIFKKGRGELKAILDLRITPELELEGIARELIRKIQELRKEAKLEVKDKIFLEIQDVPSKLKEAILRHKDWILKKTVAKEIFFEKRKENLILEKKVKINQFEVKILLYGKNFRNQGN